MRTLTRVVRSALALGLLCPVPSVAQGVWDAPSFVRPGAPLGLTLALTDSEPGDGRGVLALWRASPVPAGLGFRAGISEAPGDGVVAVLGVDVSGSLTRLVGLRGPAAIWWSGAGVGLGDGLSASFPLGAAFCWAGRSGGVSFMPSVGGHVVLDVLMGEQDDLALEGALDLGLDLAFSGGWVIRLGAAVGGRDALAIGVRVPG